MIAIPQHEGVNAKITKKKSVKNSEAHRMLSDRQTVHVPLTVFSTSSDSNDSGRSGRSNTCSSGKVGGPPILGMINLPTHCRAGIRRQIERHVFEPSCTTSSALRNPVALQHFGEFRTLIVDSQGFARKRWQPLCAEGVYKHNTFRAPHILAARALHECVTHIMASGPAWGQVPAPC